MTWKLPDGSTHAPSEESGVVTRCGRECREGETWWAVEDEPSCADCRDEEER